MGIEISSQAYQALSVLDKDKNGISAKELQELKKLDTNKDGKLSKDELKDFGITDEKDIEAINTALAKSSTQNPSEIVFPGSKEKTSSSSIEGKLNSLKDLLKKPGNEDAIKKNFEDLEFKDIQPDQAKTMAKAISNMNPSDIKKLSEKLSQLNTEQKSDLLGALTGQDEKTMQSAFRILKTQTKIPPRDMTNFKISSETLEALKRKGMDKDTIESLKSLVGKPFKNVPEIQEALKKLGITDETKVQMVTTNSPGSDWKSLLKKLSNPEQFYNFLSLRRDAKKEISESPSVKDIDQLRSKSGIDEKWTGHPELKKLVDFLKDNGMATPENLTYIEKTLKLHGKEKLEKICKNLTEFLSDKTNVPGIDKKTIIKDALHDISSPSNIEQGNKGTCAATAAQMKLAAEEPERYVSMLTTLAGGKSFELFGCKLKANDSWKNDKSDSRTLSCKILQNAIMELGKGSYNSAGPKAHLDGMDEKQMDKMVKALFGKDYRYLEIGDDPAKQEEAFKRIEDDIARGKPVAIAVEGHAATVMGIDKSENPPKVIINSEGYQYSMSVEDFKKKIKLVFDRDDSGSNDKKTPEGSKTIHGDS